MTFDRDYLRQNILNLEFYYWYNFCIEILYENQNNIYIEIMSLVFNYKYRQIK